ncbi:MAG: VIT domain-containing protein, partial [Myxococcales bacterium]
APVEGVYVFPLPEGAAVEGFRLKVGDRVIEAEVQQRAQARRTFEQARARGHTAALLEQERPNVFTQTVTNLAPGAPVEVLIRLVQPLAFDSGVWEFAFPLVVGPRYFPGGSDEADAARVRPPVHAEGVRGRHEVAVEVTLRPGFPLREVEVPTHETRTERLEGNALRLTLAPHDRIPNRDFVLRYRSEARTPEVAALAHRTGSDGYFTVLLQPPALDADAEVGRRELLFVVDVSGSMSGVPLWLCQQAMRDSLERLRPHDTFNVLTFSGATARLFPSPRRASPENVREALRFVNRMAAGGGTELLDAVREALSPDVEPGRRRYVFFLTDGYVGNEAEIIASTGAFVDALERQGRIGRVFAFGVGAAVNRFLIDGLGRAGRGAAVYATNREGPARAVTSFFRAIDRPILRDVELDWGGLAVRDVTPSASRDLLSTRPLVLHGRYEQAGVGRVVLRARTERGERVTLPFTLELPERAEGARALPALWARGRGEGRGGKHTYQPPHDGHQT